MQYAITSYNFILYDNQHVAIPNPLNTAYSQQYMRNEDTDMNAGEDGVNLNVEDSVRHRDLCNNGRL